MDLSCNLGGGGGIEKLKMNVFWKKWDLPSLELLSMAEKPFFLPSKPTG